MKNKYLLIIPLLFIMAAGCALLATRQPVSSEYYTANPDGTIKTNVVTHPGYVQGPILPVVQDVNKTAAPGSTTELLTGIGALLASGAVWYLNRRELKKHIASTEPPVPK